MIKNCVCFSVKVLLHLASYDARFVMLMSVSLSVFTLLQGREKSHITVLGDRKIFRC